MSRLSSPEHEDDDQDMYNPPEYVGDSDHEKDHEDDAYSDDDEHYGLCPCRHCDPEHEDND